MSSRATASTSSSGAIGSSQPCRSRTLARIAPGRGDPRQGYADQAHQIRSWRTRLDRTPGSYVRDPASVMARLERERSGSTPAFYL